MLARLDAWANRLYGSRLNPLYHSGAIVVVLLLVLIVTGLYLLLFYRIGSPWQSVTRIADQVWAGRWIRGLHRFSADAIVVATVIHGFRMYAQSRSWGPRVLAWVTGVGLLGVIMLSGWTGFVLVWDVHAQFLAVEGARLLDALPILADPVGRTFVGERGLPSAFFFLNLFVHIALPIGLGLLLWVHVIRVARPKLMPPRALAWGVITGLALLAIVWPLGVAPAANALRIPDRVPIDAFYSFWLPFARQSPAWATWLVGIVVFGVLLLVPVISRRSAPFKPTPSVVDARACTGCEQCALDCPYGAISMVTRTDGRKGLVAVVETDLCTGCGICIGSCGPMTVGPPGATGQDQLALVKAFVDRVKPGPRDVVVVGCAWSAATSGPLLFPVGCGGTVHTSTIERLIRNGAGGVMVVTCPERDCRNREGAHWLRARVDDGRAAELKPRVDRRRVRIVAAAAGEKGLLEEELRDFAEEIGFLARLDVAEPVDIIDLCRTGVEQPDDREFGT